MNPLEFRKVIRELASRIVALKSSHKGVQREFSRFQVEYGIPCSQKKALPQKFEPQYFKLLHKQSESAGELDSARFDARLRHIVYALARGRTLSQIEQKVREGNEIVGRFRREEQLRALCEEHGVQFPKEGSPVAPRRREVQTVRP